MYTKRLKLVLSTFIVCMFATIATTFAQTFTASDIQGDLGASYGAVMGDVNGNGFLDIYVANQNAQNRLWTNDGLGNFSTGDITDDVFNSRGAAMGDVNGNGFLDIYVANQFNQQNKLWINNGSGSFTPADITGDLGSSTAVIMGDVNGDGFLDIYVTNEQNQQNRLWINDGLGNFTAANIADDLGASYGAVMGDVNGNGFLDIYVANFNQQNKLWINNGSGSFTASDILGDERTSRGAVMGDVNGNGFLDIYVANVFNSQNNRLWINNGSGSFTAADITGDTGASYGAVMGDVNGNGFLDIYVTTIENQQNRLWINNGSGSFTAANIEGDLGESYGAAMGDVNGNGNLDIYVANLDQQNLLWINGDPTFLVRFFDDDGVTLLATQTVSSGNDAVPIVPTRTGYTFSGWNPSDFTNITASTDFTAEYLICEPGSYEDGGVCNLCPVGTFQADFGATSCQVCEAGTYQDNVGATSCIDIPEPLPSGGGGAGGGHLKKDTCPDGDFSGSYYDGICGEQEESMDEEITVISLITPTICTTKSEYQAAYDFAYGYSITTMAPCAEADMDGTLIRAHAAKMMSNYAMNVLDMQPDTDKVCDFDDMDSQTQEMKDYAILACQLGLMGLAGDGITPADNFNPNESLDKAQFATTLSRMMYGSTHDNNAGGFRVGHVQAMQEAEIITVTIDLFDPLRRSFAMIMLMRLAE